MSSLLYDRVYRGIDMKRKNSKLAICQMAVTADKAFNLEKAEAMIKAASAAHCQIAILPEMFNCPYQTELFSQYAESYPGGETLTLLSQVAAREKIVVVGGSIAEKDEHHMYNTSFVFDETGTLLGRHRKMHLFDVDIKGGTVFTESSTLSAGQDMTVIEAAGVKLGIAICYDIRFPELSRSMVLAGADILIFPAVFGLTTGPAHWELLMRSRAVDHQVFVVGAAPGNRLENPAPSVYGHSIVVNPWGDIVGQMGFEEGLLIVDLHLEQIDAVREQLPLLKHLRPDIYEGFYKHSIT